MVNPVWFPIKACPATDPPSRFGVVPWEVGAEAFRKKMSLRTRPVTDVEIREVAFTGGLSYWEMDQLMYQQWREHFVQGWVQYNHAVATAHDEQPAEVL